MFRHRVTVFNPRDSNDNIIEYVGHDLLRLSPLEGFAREDKYSWAQSHLPSAVSSLRIQWAPVRKAASSPLWVEYYTQPPGLQVYATPQEGVDVAQFYAQLNQLASEWAGINVTTADWVANSNVVTWISPNFSSASILLSRLSSLLPPEDARQFDALAAANVDVYLTHDKSTLKAFTDNWVSPNSAFAPTSPQTRHEIGIFILDREITTADDLMLSGVRYVIDPTAPDNDKLHQTMFHVKPRHRVHGKYTVGLVQPQGLHPTLQFRGQGPSTLPHDADVSDCKLYYYHAVSKSFFIDKFQLPKHFSTVLMYGDSDLEAPEYRCRGWGVEAMFEVDGSRDFDLTLHSRYQAPVTDASTTRVDRHMGSPMLFYACSATEANLLATSPFDTPATGPQGFFTNDTVFYHLQSSSPVLTASIPRARGNPALVESLTLAVVALGFAWLVYKMAAISYRSSYKKKQ
ncbi:Protein PBN1 [[Candida] zeylanoides]